MNNFMNHFFDISQPGFCAYVDSGLGRISNSNRGDHVLLFSMSKKTKIYQLDDGRILEFKYNDILYLPQGSGYVCKTLPTGMFYMLEFFMDTPPVSEAFVMTPKDPAKFQASFAAAAKVHKKKETAYKMQIMSILYEIIATMQIECSQKYIASNTKAIIAPAMEYIHSNYTKQQFNIGDLAEMCSISEDYFRKLFKSTYNISPRKYINRLKTAYAAELIHSGMHTITDACFLSGFENTSYFSREFKKKYGVSPLDYKNSATTNDEHNIKAEI